MARAAVKMPDDFLERIAKLNSHFDDIVPRVLEKGAEPVIQKAKSNLAARIGQGTKEPSQSSGELLASLETTKAVQMQKVTGI